MLRVTFFVFSKVLGREFRNVELHRSMADASLRACALGWQIEKVEPATAHMTIDGDKVGVRHS